MKKVLALLIASIMCFAFAASAFAEDPGVTIKFMYYADDTQKAILEEACAAESKLTRSSSPLTDRSQQP